ncbi:MAG TPA: glutamate--tRNA ligase [Steroidobacter sp.]|nr:glutamate--tRNA ligase [Steroidobacter sp.]
MPAATLVTRFAPSPTGLLHIGNARTGLLNFLAARKAGGRFILRVEDTDEARSSEAHMQALFEDLRWLGLEWDEGPDVGGPHGPYRQQQRRGVYQEWLARLDAAGLTYPCFCTPAELSVARKQQLAAGKPPRYAGTCRALSEAQRAERRARGLPSALRFRVPPGETVIFNDLVHGEQRFQTDDIGDFIIRRADGGSAFFFSNALDDALMGVTLVLRGEDHMTNSPRQILLLRALDLPVPQYAHVALLLGMDGAPLSKREGALSLRELRDRGYLPCAVRNHLVRLGHTCSTDDWLDEGAMIQDFDLARLGRAAARFDEAQLRHWQKEAVARLPAAEFDAWIAARLPQSLEGERRASFIAAIRPNVEFPQDVAFWVQVLTSAPPELSTEAAAVVREAGEAFFVAAKGALAREGVEFRSAVRELGKETGRKGPSLYMPLRAALTSATHGPELAPLFALIPADEVRARLERARRLAS